jgi:hypothetical protein
MASASDFLAKRIFILRPNEKELSHDSLSWQTH